MDNKASDVSRKDSAKAFSIHIGAEAIAPAVVEDDADLDELLNSALEDFGKPPPTACTTASKTSIESPDSTHTQKPATSAASDAGCSSQEELFNNIFSSELGGQIGSAEVENMMRTMMSSDPELLQQFEKLHSAAHEQDATGGGGSGGAEGKQQFSDAIQQTLGYLAQNVENIKAEGDDPFSDEELMKLVSGLNFEDGDESNSGFVPLMHGMMKSILSKDILYPSLKDIVSKYPSWLSSHESGLSSDDLTRYRRQHELMQRICVHFEEETDSDTEQVKKDRFEAVMDLMQQMQELGQPPKDLIGESGGLPFGDSAGLNQEPCTVM